MMRNPLSTITASCDSSRSPFTVATALIFAPFFNPVNDARPSAPVFAVRPLPSTINSTS
jgi:hypothetical protein